LCGSTDTARAAGSVTALSQQVTLGGEVGEPGTERLRYTQGLTFTRRLGEPVMTHDIMLRQVTGSLSEVTTYTLGEGSG